jgi:hypothetical protein
MARAGRGGNASWPAAEQGVSLAVNVRTFLGFLLAPATLAIVDALATMASPDMRQSEFLSGRIYWTLSITYPLTLLFGVPAYFLHRKRGWFRWWQITATGALIGALPGGGFALVFRLWNDLGELLLTVLVFAGIGAASAAVFWMVAFAGAGGNGKANQALERT